MNINRHNYEEFFLLYADNELPADQRRAVEDFVKHHPDLQEEFNLLNDLRLDPDATIQFDNKESLFQTIHIKEEITPVAEDEEKILRFIDGELSMEEIAEFTLKLEKNTGLQDELELFSKTKIQPDYAIVFPDKSVLYRNSGEKVRVIRMTWVRVAVAAAIILTAGILWINNSADVIDGIGPLAFNTEKTDMSNPASGIAEKENGPLQNIPEKVQQVTSEIQPDQDTQTAAVAKPRAAKALLTNQKKDQATDQKSPEDKDSQILAVLNPTERQQANITTPGNEQPLVNASPNHGKISDIVDLPVTDADVKSNYATEALMSTQDAVEVVTLENSNTRKSPIRGIVRKANRLFNKVTNPDLDKPMIKVANFEIALAK